MEFVFGKGAYPEELKNAVLRGVYPEMFHPKRDS
jgi:hypothetical protein